MAEDKKTHDPHREAETEVPLTGPAGESKTVDETARFSDVALDESGTLAAPTFPAPVPRPAPANPAVAPTVSFRDQARPRGRDMPPLEMLPGTKVDDFEIVRLLGRGAFGHVYLARQISLDRLVALKVSANRGSEGRTMARLEHQHIVQVFSETVEPAFNQRLLCMQLVPGIGLDKLINLLHKKDDKNQPANLAPWNGEELIAIIDRSATLPAALDPAALHDREAISHMDAIEVTAWFGGRLAEALDFAHHHGVLHRDIKPANILVNPYGRPMLADFNISSQPVGSEPGGDDMFGGTFAYMAPEHLDAFNPTDDTGHDAVTARSDIYSLGLVLGQMLGGRLAFSVPKKKDHILDALRNMAAERRRDRPPCQAGPPGARMTLERSIGRCLAPDPDHRFASSAELAEQLDGCRHLRQAERHLPKLPEIVAQIARWPFAWLIALVLLPQLAASAVNIVYNQTQIAGYLTDQQERWFNILVIAYNAVIYPIAVLLFVLAVRPLWKTWNALARGEPLAEGQVEFARRRSLRLPRWIAALVAFGWLPGGIVFPVTIAIMAPVLKPEVIGHFFMSFFLSGLIAMAYSLCGVEFLVLRVIYPAMWRNAQHFRRKTRFELTHIDRQLGRIEFLAGSIPLVAAGLLLLMADDLSMTFRLLVVALILLGGVGFHLTSAITRSLSQVVVALTSTKD